MVNREHVLLMNVLELILTNRGHNTFHCDIYSIFCRVENVKRFQTGGKTHRHGRLMIRKAHEHSTQLNT